MFSKWRKWSGVDLKLVYWFFSRLKFSFFFLFNFSTSICHPLSDVCWCARASLTVWINSLPAVSFTVIQKKNIYSFFFSSSCGRLEKLNLHLEIMAANRYEANLALDVRYKPFYSPPPRTSFNVYLVERELLWRWWLLSCFVLVPHKNSGHCPRTVNG